MVFVGRTEELAALQTWWKRPGSSIGLIWGRRRVGKTALLQEFAKDRPHIFHTGAGRPALGELRALSNTASTSIDTGLRALSERPFTDWTDAFETLATLATDKPLLLVLDEFPEMVSAAPELPSVLRAVWDRLRGRTQLRILLSGSAVRVVREMQEERAPLYGRMDLRMMLHPFAPNEASLLLPGASPADRALIWGIVGGIPLYLEWWNENQPVRSNLLRLICSPGGPLLTEGELTLATIGETGDLVRQVLYAIAGGHTKHNEIATAIRADPSRTLDRLVEQRIVERLVPITEDPLRTRRRVYRVSDNFLGFWLGLIDRYRPEIERGLGDGVASVLVQSLDDYMGPRWEDAFRHHLRRLAREGSLGEDVVAVGPFWTSAGEPVEIDAVVLAGRAREAVWVGEAKWARELDGDAVRHVLERKAEALPRSRDELRFAVAARERVRGGGVLAITAADIFGT